MVVTEIVRLGFRRWTWVSSCRCSCIFAFRTEREAEAALTQHMDDHRAGFRTISSGSGTS